MAEEACTAGIFMGLPTPIPVIDLFAGPGGLGEGFSACRGPHGLPQFRIALSVEKEANAYRTLLLRSFYRQFPAQEAPGEYYQYLRGDITRDQLFAAHAAAAETARQEAWCAELGSEAQASEPVPLVGQVELQHPDHRDVSTRIGAALAGAREWVLIGGPPCQAYSIAGRSRNRGKEGYRPEDDRRHYLYLEYLQIIADHAPCVFIMENVKGLLSSTLQEKRIFDQILDDLRFPARALARTRRHNSGSKDVTYTLHSVTRTGADRGQRQSSFLEDPIPSEYLVEAEKYGIPQARHRVFIVGVRDDLAARPGKLTPVAQPVPVWDVLNDLPPLRSGLSRTTDGPDEWRQAVQDALNRRWLKGARKNAGRKVQALITSTIRNLPLPQADRGEDFVDGNPGPCQYHQWFVDPQLKGFCNHQTRVHIGKDIWRYLYAACYAAVHDRSPVLADFPRDLLPKHRNVDLALARQGYFQERFRVQLRNAPATTITSHICKDGHHFIHPDPAQCRSLTVREAARLQTFPDNYFFEGPRTAQYVQVGNAVPPLLARQIADITYGVLARAGLTGHGG